MGFSFIYSKCLIRLSADENYLSYFFKCLKCAKMPKVPKISEMPKVH
jgi:hypothetical protein